MAAPSNSTSSFDATSKNQPNNRRSSAGAAAGSGSERQAAAGAAATDEETIYSRDEDRQECIDNCTDCAQVCEQMVTHCLSKGGPHSAPEHIRLLIDCANICQTSAGFMLRGSPLHHLTCGACAEVCTACADDCEKMNDDEMMNECIEICRRCATTCEAMSSQRQ
jgi:hypothetical protein